MYIPIRRGFLYLVAVMDWASRAVLAWRLSNTMDTSFCVAALQEALARSGRPEIFNTDQGSRFISMDSRGRWMDNVFIERLWRSLKYDDIYLKGYADGREAHASIALWVAFATRPHQALGGRTSMAILREGVTAVDMTLSLDKLSRCPHAHSRNKGAAADSAVRRVISGSRSGPESN